MGQFYTATDIPVIDDKMFQLPFEFMAKVLERKDDAIQSDVNSASALQELLNAQGLKPDEPRLNQKLSEYQDKIDATVNSIKKNPLNYDTNNIISLKREINSDFKNGEIGAIQANRNAYLEWEKDLEAKVKANPKDYSPNQVELLKQAKLEEFANKKGTSYQGPDKYNPFSTEDVAGMKPTMDYLKELMEGAIQDKNVSVKWDNDKGAWRVKGEKTEKEFTDDMLNKLYIESLTTNPDYLAGLKQRDKLGIEGFQGNFDTQGNPIIEPNNFIGQSLSLIKTKFGGLESVEENSRLMSDQGKMDYASWLKQKEEAEETEYNHQAVSAEMTTYGGKNNSEFNGNYQNSQKAMQNAAKTATNLVMEQYGYKDEATFMKKDPKLFNQIQKGDFTGVKDGTIRSQLSSSYKQAQLEKAHMNALIYQFKKDTGLDYGDFGNKSTIATITDNKGNKRKVTKLEAWNNFLAKTSEGIASKDATWEGTGITQKKIDSVNKSYFNSGNYKVVPLKFPIGTKIGTYTVTEDGVSINDLIKKGVILPTAEKVPTLQRGGGPTTDVNGQPIPPTYTIAYKIANGKGTLNFDPNTSVTPILSYNDNGKIDMQFTVEVNGKTYSGRDDSFATTSTKEFENVNWPVLKVKQKLAKLSGIDNVELPDTGGVIYHGKDVYVKHNGVNKRIHKAGTVSFPNGRGGYDTRTSDDPKVIEILARHLN